MTTKSWGSRDQRYLPGLLDREAQGYEVANASACLHFAFQTGERSLIRRKRIWVASVKEEAEAHERRPWPR